MISKIAFDYKVGEPIPSLVYTAEEKAVWKLCYNKLAELFKTNAC